MHENTCVQTKIELTSTYKKGFSGKQIFHWNISFYFQVLMMTHGKNDRASKMLRRLLEKISLIDETTHISSGNALPGYCKIPQPLMENNSFFAPLMVSCTTKKKLLLTKHFPAKCNHTGTKTHQFTGWPLNPWNSKSFSIMFSSFLSFVVICKDQ